MLPNLFIIGAPKCGTSSLAFYLGEHEQVFITDPKEPFYFCSDYPELKKQHFLSDEESYLELYEEANCSQHIVAGEGSTNYLASKLAIKNILQFNSKAKFIVLLRDPVEVAHAFHMEQVFARNEDEEDFEKAWHLQEVRAKGEKIPETCIAPQFLMYREVANYSEQLERLFTLVPENQRLVLFQEDLKYNTQKVYIRSLEFLGVPYDGRTEFPVLNSSHKHRSDFIANLVLRPPTIMQTPIWTFRNFARRHRVPPIEFIKKMLRVNAKRQDMSDAFRNELYEIFLPDIKHVETLLDTRLDNWKCNPPEKPLDE